MMVRMKYIFLLLVIYYVLHPVTSQTCQAIRNKLYWKPSFVLRCNHPEDSWWECVQGMAFPKAHEPDFWEKLKSTTECFSWEVFEESDDSEDFVTLPFENIINLIEFIISDFIQFYIEYVSNIFSTIWNLRMLGFLVNPATVFLLSMYIFHKKMFMPLLRNIQRDFKMEEDSEFANCDISDDIEEIPKQDNVDIDTS